MPQQQLHYTQARRVVLEEGGLRSAAAANWLCLSKTARLEGRWEVALPALRHAALHGAPPAALALQEGKLLHAQGQVHKALQVC